MTGLSVAHQAALARVFEDVPDGALGRLAQLAAGASGVPGELQPLIADEQADRARRARALAPLLPLFRARDDGVEGLTFPAEVLPRLWKLARAGESGFLDLLDDRDERNDARATAVCARLCVAAAAAVRDQAEAIWPPGATPDEAREAGLAELARCCDLGPLAHRALPHLGAWVGRPDEGELTELRLAIRDAGTVAADGARRLLDILFAHLADAGLILRLVAQASTAAVREGFLARSELGVFVERLLIAADRRAAAVVAFKGGGAAALRRDLVWIAEVLNELEITLQIEPAGPWGQRVQKTRRAVGRALTDQLSAVGRAVDLALPMTRVQTAGRMTRQAPRLDAPTDPAVMAAASEALALTAAIRGPAAAFGCEAPRRQAEQTCIEQLAVYGDLALEAINAGEVADAAVALTRVEDAARLLDLIGAADEARTLRRRAIVAGRSSAA